jgi:hypothetical protein
MNHLPHSGLEGTRDSGNQAHLEGRRSPNIERMNSQRDKRSSSPVQEGDATARGDTSTSGSLEGEGPRLFRQATGGGRIGAGKRDATRSRVSASPI